MKLRCFPAHEFYKKLFKDIYIYMFLKFFSISSNLYLLKYNKKKKNTNKLKHYVSGTLFYAMHSTAMTRPNRLQILCLSYKFQNLLNLCSMVAYTTLMRLIG